MLRRFHPIIRKWFTETLGKPSDPQRKGWPAIATGEHALILAPTGTGKTLAAFLWEPNALITAGLKEPLGNSVHSDAYLISALPSAARTASRIAMTASSRAAGRSSRM